MGKLKPNKRIRTIAGSTLFEGDSSRDVEHATDSQKDLTDSVTSKSEEKTGAIGTMRVVSNGKNYHLEIKTDSGWIISNNTSVSGFSLKKK